MALLGAEPAAKLIAKETLTRSGAATSAQLNATSDVSAFASASSRPLLFFQGSDGRVADCAFATRVFITRDAAPLSSERAACETEDGEK